MCEDVRVFRCYFPSSVARRKKIHIYARACVKPFCLLMGQRESLRIYRRPRGHRGGMRGGDDGAGHLAPPQGIIYERLTAPVWDLRETRERIPVCSSNSSSSLSCSPSARASRPDTRRIYYVQGRACTCAYTYLCVHVCINRHA